MKKNQFPDRRKFSSEEEFIFALSRYMLVESYRNLEDAKNQAKLIQELRALQELQELTKPKSPAKDIIVQELKEKSPLLGDRLMLIGSSRRSIRSFYKLYPVVDLQCELILWQESEHYEICQVLKEMIDKKLTHF